MREKESKIQTSDHQDVYQENVQAFIHEDMEHVRHARNIMMVSGAITTAGIAEVAINAADKPVGLYLIAFGAVALIESIDSYKGNLSLLKQSRSRLLTTRD